jgi:hypothetical protein
MKAESTKKGVRRKKNFIQIASIPYSVGIGRPAFVEVLNSEHIINA